MSLRHEQYRSLLEARKLLFNLIIPKATPRVPKSVRNRASHCLRHFPFFDEAGRPMFSEDTKG